MTEISYTCLEDPIQLSFQSKNLLDLVSCCFKCCFEYFVSLFKFRQIDLKSIDNVPITKPSFVDLLYGVASLYSISSYIITEKQVAGNLPVMQISTITSLSQNDWHRVKGRRLTLVTHVEECIPLSRVQNIANSQSHFNNPTVAKWFTTQMPCESVDINSTSYKSGMRFELLRNVHRPYYPNSEPWIHINLIPIGVRDSRSLTTRLRSTSSHSTRDILLDCTCYFEHSSIVRESWVQYCFQDMSKTLKSNDSKLSEYYDRLQRVKYIVSPSSSRSLSTCEWEAIAAGAIPLLDEDLRRYYDIEQLYVDLPVVYVRSWEVITPTFLNNIYESLITVFTNTSPSTSFPIQLPVDISIAITRKTLLSKLFFPFWLNKLSSNLITGKHVAKFFPDIDDAVSKLPLVSCNLPSRRFQSPTVSKLSRTGELKPVVIERNIVHNVRNYNLSLTSKRNVFVIEIIIPRCCENKLEFSWPIPLLKRFPAVKLSIHYKCPGCLPASKATEWLPNIRLGKDTSKRASRGVLLIDDSDLTQFGTRVIQVSSIDSTYNGKEVTAYLNHIVNNYESLAEQSIFLHSVPHAHLFMELFLRTMHWLEACQKPIYFMHLNAKYKEGLWGECCGKLGSCKRSTWNYLFPSAIGAKKPFPRAVGTYSSAQFIASKDAIRGLTKDFWTRMLYAINGSHDLLGCPSSSEGAHLKFGGHQLTGQYERFWHIIFQQDDIQVKRSRDNYLPEYLRLDCKADQCDGNV